MAEDKITRKLATILATDVEGYTRLMRADEEATFKTLGEYREIIDGLIARHEGRVFSTGGDSVLAEFGSAVEAVRCAISCQEEISSRNAELADDRKLIFRIGINVGDVMVRDGDLFGDGVNVAARLEGLAEAGGVCISGSVFEQIKHKLSLGFEDMGPHEVKNMAEPIRVYRVKLEQRDTAVIPVSEEAEAHLSRSALAVLPFANLSGDPEQDYFSDGLTEDIITALSAWRTFPVIARNSVFTYKGKAVKVQQVAEDQPEGQMNAARRNVDDDPDAENERQRRGDPKLEKRPQERDHADHDGKARSLLAADIFNLFDCLRDVFRLDVRDHRILLGHNRNPLTNHAYKKKRPAPPRRGRRLSKASGCYIQPFSL
jgi:class 3 adenylate cyclase